MVEDVLNLEGEAEWGKDPGQGDRHVVRYPEWDAAIQDYRSRWCSLFEREAEEGSSDFVEQTLSAQRGPIRLLRRYFESLSPSGFRRLAGQIDGEDMDLDAVVRRQADPTRTAARIHRKPAGPVGRPSRIGRRRPVRCVARR